MKENKELQKIENIMEIEIPIDTTSKEFEKVMFIYKVALKEINTKLEILKDELFDKFHNDINIVVIDFMKKETVLEGAKQLTELNIDVLINNAGIYHCDKQLVDNHDITYYVNFLMPMLLTNNLLKNKQILPKV